MDDSAAIDRLEPNHTVADSRKIPTKIPEHLERFLDGLRKAGPLE